jgi:transcriptional regulator with XRE-family HTH domain
MPLTSKPQYVEFGRRLRATREALNVEISVLARRAGISPKALYNYEAGIRMPNPIGEDSDGARLCNALGIEMNWLYRADSRWLTMQLSETLQAHWKSLNEPLVIETAKIPKRRRKAR